MKNLRVLIVLLFVALGAFMLPNRSEAYFQAGTCCPTDLGTCVIGSHVEHDAWARLDGRQCHDPIEETEE